MRKFLAITLSVLFACNTLRAWDNPAVQLRGAYTALAEYGFFPQPGIAEVHVATTWDKGKSALRFRFDQQARMTGYEHFDAGQLLLSYTWTYRSNDSLPVSATRIIGMPLEEEKSTWLFESLGRVSEVMICDTTGKTVRRVLLVYDDCLSTARFQDLLQDTFVTVSEETMDCQGAFNVTTFGFGGAIAAVKKDVFRSEVSVWEYLVFPRELPPIRLQQAHQRFFGQRTVINVYKPNGPDMSRKSLVEKNVQDSEGRWIKRKYYGHLLARRYVVRGRWKYNKDGLPVKVTVRNAQGFLFRKMTSRFTYTMAVQ